MSNCLLKKNNKNHGLIYLVKKRYTGRTVISDLILKKNKSFKTIQKL